MGLQLVNRAPLDGVLLEAIRELKLTRLASSSEAGFSAGLSSYCA